MRLDQALVARGLARSRAQASDAVKRGLVMLSGRLCLKPSQKVGLKDKITLKEELSLYVSRGALKLAHALESFDLDVTGGVAIDLGASTGGFTDLLLQQGASKIYAIDVGTDQLDETLRADSRVISLEQLNAKDVRESHVPELVDLIVCDVSFISLTKALPASLARTNDTADLICLIKPQFEVGREGVGKGGIVRDETLHAHVIGEITAWVNQQEGWHVMGVCPSPITGPDGNKEFLLHGRKSS